MVVDWTIHFADLLVMATFGTLGIGVMWTFHSRLKEVEVWIKLEGSRAQRAMEVLSTLGTALAEVTALYREMNERLKRNEDLLIIHHQDYHIHNLDKGR